MEEKSKPEILGFDINSSKDHHVKKIILNKTEGTLTYEFGNKGSEAQAHAKKILINPKSDNDLDNGLENYYKNNSSDQKISYSANNLHNIKISWQRLTKHYNNQEIPIQAYLEIQRYIRDRYIRDIERKLQEEFIEKFNFTTYFYETGNNEEKTSILHFADSPEKVKKLLEENTSQISFERLLNPFDYFIENNKRKINDENNISAKIELVKTKIAICEEYKNHETKQNPPDQNLINKYQKEIDSGKNTFDSLNTNPQNSLNTKKTQSPTEDKSPQKISARYLIIFPDDDTTRKNCENSLKTQNKDDITFRSEIKYFNYADTTEDIFKIIEAMYTQTNRFPIDPNSSLAVTYKQSGPIILTLKKGTSFEFDKSTTYFHNEIYSNSYNKYRYNGITLKLNTGDISTHQSASDFYYGENNWGKTNYRKDFSQQYEFIMKLTTDISHTEWYQRGQGFFSRKITAGASDLKNYLSLNTRHLDPHDHKKIQEILEKVKIILTPKSTSETGAFKKFFRNPDVQEFYDDKLTEVNTLLENLKDPNSVKPKLQL